MSVRKRGESWLIDFAYIDPVTSRKKRFRRSTGAGVRKREAEALERRLRHEMETADSPTHRKGAAFSGFAAHWLDLREPDWKHATYRAYEQITRVHLVPYFGDEDMRAIPTERVQAYKATKLREGLKAKTVNNHLSCLSSLFRSAVAWEYCERNPVKGVSPVVLPPAKFKYWTQDQSDAFLATARTEVGELYPFFLAALRTGMRIGELFGLEWGDLDFVLGRIHVQRNWTHGRLETPKSGRARFIPMTAELQQALRDHRHLKGDLVFSTADGGYLDRNKVKHPFWRTIRISGVEKITLHDMRHSFASQLAMKGVPLRAIQELLGHAHITTTQRYAHLSPSATADYVAVLEQPTKGSAARDEFTAHLRHIEGGATEEQG